MTSLRAINDLSRHNGAIADELAAAVSRVLDSGWYILGTEVAAFERAFAEYCGVAFAVGVGNGTDALELALAAVGVGREQKVALAANAGGYGTTAVNAIGAVPVYVDVDAGTFGLDPSALERVLRAGDIRAVIVTHLYGGLADIEEITRVSTAYGVKLIEDCAQAHGAERDGSKAGSWGDAAAFSFYPTKNLGALGDAGAVVTGDPELANRVATMRQYGWDGKYSQAMRPGRNSRLDELQAAVLLTKLPRLDGWNAGRSAIAARYRERIAHPKVVLPAGSGPDHVAHLFVVRTGERDALAQHLRENGVPHDVHYPQPDYRQPAHRERFADVSLPMTEQLCAEVLTLPCFPEMTIPEVDQVADVINGWS